MLKQIRKLLCKKELEVDVGFVFLFAVVDVVHPLPRILREVEYRTAHPRLQSHSLDAFDEAFREDALQEAPNEVHAAEGLFGFDLDRDRVLLSS